MPNTQTRADKTDAGNCSKAIFRASHVFRSPSPDPRRSVLSRAHFMNWNDLYRWRIGNSLPDVWWCAFDGTVDGPFPLKRIISLADNHKATEVNVRHVSSIGDDGWVTIKIERSSAIPVAATRPIVRKHVEPDNEAWFSNGCQMLIYLVVGGLALSVILMMFEGGSNSSEPRTDGVFESAIKKMDSGRADQLTPKEAQRIDDIVNWCNICNKPLRNCKHGE
jgi:hypothetical protein